MSSPQFFQLPKEERIAYLRGMSASDRLDYTESLLSPKNWTSTHRPANFLPFEEFLVFFYIPIHVHVSKISESIADWNGCLQESLLSEPGFKSSETYKSMIRAYNEMRPPVIHLLCHCIIVRDAAETYALDMGRLGMLKPFLARFIGMTEDEVNKIDLEDASIVGFKAGVVAGNADGSVFGSLNDPWRILYKRLKLLDSEFEKFKPKTVDSGSVTGSDVYLESAENAVALHEYNDSMEQIGKSSSKFFQALSALNLKFVAVIRRKPSSVVRFLSRSTARSSVSSSASRAKRTSKSGASKASSQVSSSSAAAATSSTASSSSAVAAASSAASSSSAASVALWVDVKPEAADSKGDKKSRVVRK